MALLGLLSLAQIVFLPGYLLTRALRVGAGILGTCVLSFALSLVINYVLVAGLVVSGCYRPAVIYAIFAAELVSLLAMDGRLLRAGLRATATAGRLRLRAFFAAILDAPLRFEDESRRMDLRVRPGRAWKPILLLLFRADGPAPGVALRRVLLAAALLVIGGFGLVGIAQMGEIFQQWDAVVSWNRWAIDWAGNRLPYAASFYPQLLPTNLSLTYVFMQTSEVWIFAKAFQFLFCLLLLVAMLDMARVTGSFGYVPGIVIAYALLVAVLRFRILSSGYADVPLAFFVYTCVYTLVLARRSTDSREQVKLLIVGALLAGGAAVTKQTGLYIAAVYPLLAWRLIWPGGLRRRLPELLSFCAIMGVLVLPWYLAKLCDFQAGCDRNNTALLLVDFHQGRNLLQRLLYAGSMIADTATLPGAVLLSICVAASLRDPLQRWLVGVVVAPLAIIWAIGFSYDLRNLSLILPLIGAAAGMGAMSILSAIAGILAGKRRSGGEGLPRASMGGWRQSLSDAPAFSASAGASRGLSRQPRGFLRVGHFAGLAALLLIAVGLCIRDTALLNCQQRQQRQIGIPELNRQLYAYAAEHGLTSPSAIASDYQALRWLPDLGRRSVICTCHEISAFRETFDRPEVRCVLVRMEGAAPQVRAFLEGQTAAALVFENHGFALYEKRPVELAQKQVSPFAPRK